MYIIKEVRLMVGPQLSMYAVAAAVPPLSDLALNLRHH